MSQIHDAKNMQLSIEYGLKNKTNLKLKKIAYDDKLIVKTFKKRVKRRAISPNCDNLNFDEAQNRSNCTRIE